MALSTQNREQRAIPTLVKDEELVAAKRARLAEAAVKLFCQNGYHPTTTRAIAREAGFSIGALYEYVKSKEDVLYLVCEAIHTEMEQRLRASIREGASARATLEEAIANYIRACDRMQDSILLVYRETSSLSAESLAFVLKNEERITAIFEAILRRGAAEGSLYLAGGEPSLRLMAHNIAVIGHMWAFRRWHLARHFSLDEFVRLQTSLLLSELSPAGPGREDGPQ